jgi:beta-lactamase regulating signal transducer with metallopeptidase domain
MQEILAPPLLSGGVRQVTQDTNIGPWVVLGVWLAGTAVVFFWWGRQWRPLRSALRSATPLRLGPDCDSGGLAVMTSPSAFEPGVVGIVRPVLLFPEGLVDRLTPRSSTGIVAHERAHVRAHDNLLAVLHMAVEAIFCSTRRGGSSGG